MKQLYELWEESVASGHEVGSFADFVDAQVEPADHPMIEKLDRALDKWKAARDEKRLTK